MSCRAGNSGFKRKKDVLLAVSVPKCSEAGFAQFCTIGAFFGEPHSK